MTTGKPFKSRMGSRPAIGNLSTPDVFKFHVPLPHAFVPIDSEKTVDKQTGAFLEKKEKKPRISLESSGLYKFNEDCQKTVINLNRCLKNVGYQNCQYYNNFLNKMCIN